ncbi:MAG: hypothetical protein ACOX5W_11945 [Bacillota bacterium]
MRYIDVHVTQFSTCIIEAEAFKVPSIIIHENGVDMYKKQIKNGIAKTAFNALDLNNKIRTLTHEKHKMGYSNDLEITQNALFEKIIKKIAKAELT